MTHDGDWDVPQYVNTEVDPQGIEFFATYADGSTKAVTPTSFSPTVWGSEVGDTECVFYYTEDGVTVEDTVVANIEEPEEEFPIERNIGTVSLDSPTLTVENVGWLWEKGTEPNFTGWLTGIMDDGSSPYCNEGQNIFYLATEEQYNSNALINGQNGMAFIQEVGGDAQSEAGYIIDDDDISKSYVTISLDTSIPSTYNGRVIMVFGKNKETVAPQNNSPSNITEFYKFWIDVRH